MDMRGCVDGGGEAEGGMINHGYPVERAPVVDTSAHNSKHDGQRGEHSDNIERRLGYIIDFVDVRG